MDSLRIRTAAIEDYDRLCGQEHHVTDEVLRACLGEGRMLVAELDGRLAGWLRWNLFWDIVPFMNHLRVLDEFRGRGFGGRLVRRWEDDMRDRGHEKVMTSSAQDECAQHFYVHLGYLAVGGFMLAGDPLELVFEKRLDGPSAAV